MSDISFTQAIAFHLYEKQADIWPHISEPLLPKPADYDTWKESQSRPHTHIDAHSELLSVEEVAHLYAGVAFAMWQHGVVMNAHITFDWRKMGVNDASDAVKLLGRYNHEAAKWLRVGKFNKDALRAGRRFGHGADFFYVHVHENGGEYGFHTHQLCFVPPAIAKPFTDWSRKGLARLTKQPTISEKAFHAKFNGSRDERQQLARCWGWFRYIVKQLDQNHEILDNEGQWRPATSIFRPWTSHQLKPLPVPVAVRVSHNIGKSQQRAAGFVSRYVTGDWDEMYYGRELDERRERLEEEARRADLEKLIPTLSL